VVGALQRLGVTVEAARPHGGQNGVLVLEIAVGRHGTYAEGGGELADGDRLGSVLGEQALGGIAQAFAEVGDVLLGEVFRQYRPFTKILLAPAYSLRHKFTM
jgi:hypothetical protein